MKTVRNYRKDPAVVSAGFYDLNGTWFYTWQADRPDERYSYACADTWDTSTQVVRLHGGKELTWEEYQAQGEKRLDNNA